MHYTVPVSFPFVKFYWSFFWTLLELCVSQQDGCDFVCRSRGNREEPPTYRGVGTEPLEEEPEERDDHLLPMWPNYNNQWKIAGQLLSGETQRGMFISGVFVCAFFFFYLPVATFSVFVPQMADCYLSKVGNSFLKVQRPGNLIL